MDNYPRMAGYKSRDTSASAADQAERNAPILREAVLSCIAKHDATADEVAMVLKASVLSVRPRVAELAAQGKIVDSTKRRPNQSGRQAIVWTIPKPNATQLEMF